MVPMGRILAFSIDMRRRHYSTCTASVSLTNKFYAHDNAQF